MFKLNRCFKLNQMIVSKTLQRQKGILQLNPNENYLKQYQLRAALSASHQSGSSDKKSTGKSKIEDEIKYVVKFKKNHIDLKELFKKFYSLYGPLFVACHIGVSLTSLGSLIALSWVLVDPVQYIPDIVLTYMGESMIETTGKGSKFLFAYCVHKILLPIRLYASAMLTLKLAKMIKYKPKANE